MREFQGQWSHVALGEGATFCAACGATPTVVVAWPHDVRGAFSFCAECAEEEVWLPED